MRRVKFVCSGQVCVQATSCYFWENAMTLLSLREYFEPCVCSQVRCRQPTGLHGLLDPRLCRDLLYLGGRGAHLPWKSVSPHHPHQNTDSRTEKRLVTEMKHSRCSIDKWINEWVSECQGLHLAELFYSIWASINIEQSPWVKTGEDNQVYQVSHPWLEPQ